MTVVMVTLHELLNKLNLTFCYLKSRLERPTNRQRMATVTLPRHKTTLKTRKQRLVNRSGNVDESLFGPPARLKQMSGNRSWGTPSTTIAPSVLSGEGERGGEKTRRQRRVSSDPDVMEVITKDLIRKIRVPSTPDPTGLTVVMNRKEFDQIRQRAQVLTQQQRKEREVRVKAEKAERLDATNLRKREMQELEMRRRQNEKPSDLEQEAQEKSSDLLATARAQMEEQDDEIKKLNEAILNAKCHAIRDAQLRERDEILKAMQEEEARLDIMMEIDRVKSLRDAEEKEKGKHMQRLKGVEVIQTQIQVREQQRLLDMEKKDQETQAMLKYLERLQEEDMEQLQKKRDTQCKLMVEVAKCNDEIQRQKALQREQQKLEDLRVMEYLQEKEKREEELAKELEQQKLEKEHELAKMRAQQERAQDKQSERDALKAKRRHEEFEREWRRKQREEAEKKAATEHMLIEARQDQIRHKEHFLAVQAQRDREEFERVLRAQQDMMEQDKEKHEVTSKRRQEHAQEVRKQVKQKEAEKVTTRKAFFEEGIKLDHEAKERRHKLDEIKQRKLSELRAAGIPEKYCAEVSRRITAPPPSFTMSQLN